MFLTTVYTYICHVVAIYVYDKESKCNQNLYASYDVMLANISAVPTPNQVDMTAPAMQTVGQSLVLRCSVITVRGITSRVDIVWSSNGLDLETVEANVSSITNNSVEYTAYYTIVQLNETDDGRVYHCKVVINASPPVMTDDLNVTLMMTSKYNK